MKYYKIVNSKGHNGMIYHEGYNEDPLPFNPSGNCEPGGIYFAREDILAFLDRGTELYEVDPVGPVYENPGESKKYKAHAVNLKYIGKVQDNIEFLIKQGANIHAEYDLALFFASLYGNLSLVKLLVKYGADIHACQDHALRVAAMNGYLKIVKILVEQGADIHSCNEDALYRAIEHGRYSIIKYLLSKGANVLANDGALIALAYQKGNKRIINLIKKYC
jgi:hypothetical protein